MPWTTEKRDGYHQYAKTYISSFSTKIDCADLAISSLIDFAAKEKLPIRFKYYSGGWKWMKYEPEKMDTQKFKNVALMKLGALNVIDNSLPIPIAGDLIMTKWNPSLGHTRIIYSIKHEAENKEYEVTWYQGNLPSIKPKKVTEYFSDIDSVFGGTPRRWNFEQFDQ